MIQYDRIDETTGEVHHTLLYSVSDVAKASGIKYGNSYVGRNTMFKLMRFNHILTRDNQPNQVLINLGLAVFHGVNKNHRCYYMPAFTLNGLNYIKRGFENGKYVLQVEAEVQKHVSIDDVC